MENLYLEAEAFNTIIDEFGSLKQFVLMKEAFYQIIIKSIYTVSLFLNINH